MADTGFDYDTIPPGYYDQVFHRNHGVQSKWHRLKFAGVAAAIAGRVRHLDIGCSAGTFIGTLQGHESVGVDLAEAQIAYARSHYAAPGRTFDVVALGPLPFAPDSFDAVTLVELVEHLPAAEAAALLRESWRVLAPAGRLVLTTPNYGSLWPLLEMLVNRLGPVSYAEQHIVRYGRKDVRRLLEAAGFVDIRVEGYLLAAPFVAAFGGALADRVADLEPAWAVDRFGFLLLASGCKAGP